MSLLLHPLSKKRYDSIVKDTPQSTILVAPAGSGKETLLIQLANDILGDYPVGRLFDVKAPEDKKSISIDAIRELKITLRLKSDLPRVVLINQAFLLTTEAQNSILKLLEDTPKNVYFLLGINDSNELIDTIKSRSAVWRLILPTSEQILTYFKDYNIQKLNKALAIGESRIGLISAILKQDKDHPLIQAIELAKDILSEKRFNRLIRVDSLYKDHTQTKLLFEALELVCKSALENAAQQKSANLKHWQKRLKFILEAIELINDNIQPKLILSRTFTVL